MSLKETKTRLAVEHAYSRGYRVTPDGVAIGLNGPVRIKLRGTQRYPTISVSYEGKPYGLPAHQLAAYCFYGDDVFRKDLCVRHLDGDTTNLRRDNIVLGTWSDNELDKHKDVRVRSASAARNAQGHRPVRHFFTDDQIRMIRQRIANGERQVDIARDLEVSRQVIYRIKKGLNYNNV